MYYVRKFSRNKYGLIESELTGDACNCLKTTQNELSFWNISELSEMALNEAVLAIATSANADKIDPIHTVVLSESFFNSEKLQLKNSPENGNTLVEDLLNSHFDLINVNVPIINSLGKEIFRLLENSKKLSDPDFKSQFIVKIHSISSIKAIIVNAIKKDRLQLEKLPEKIQLIISNEIEKNNK